jgi:RNA polymerase sigma-70 factor (ECF subfamily)
VASADFRAAYEELLRRYAAPMRRLSWSYERDPIAREDLFQEIAMALWTALPRFRGESSERTWVYRVAHNTAVTFAAKRQRTRERERHDDTVPEPWHGPTQEGDAINEQRRRYLWKAIHDLPLTDRQILMLHLEGLSAEDIEAVTAVSSGAVATRLTRLRQRLIARLREPQAADGEVVP